MTNVEIGNMTLGSAACCHTKDGLDGVPFGQVSSYLTKVKWVTPSGDLAEASEDKDPEALLKMRSSYGLVGVIYEATFRVKPLEAIHFSYLPRPVAALTENELANIAARSQGLVCWTLGRTVIFQTRMRAERVSALGPAFAAVRRRLSSRSMSHLGRSIDSYLPAGVFRDFAHEASFGGCLLVYRALHLLGGCAIANPDKTIDYRGTPPSGKYVFTFWTFPAAAWLGALRDYLEFEKQHFNKYGFRCNMPLGSYYIRKDASGILSYASDGDVFSLDPIHAPVDRPAWDRFLREFNEFSHKRNGRPLINQSPWVEKKHVAAAYGEAWREFASWVRAADPAGRMRNAFFTELLG
jgi:hypothetical protein